MTYIGRLLKTTIRRYVCLILTLALLLGSVPVAALESSNASPINLTNAQFASSIESSIINQHTNDDSGWAYISKVQYPNYQTDRDVGAASVGTGLLDAYVDSNSTNTGAINGAKEIATWLTNISVVSQNTRHWNDYVNPGSVSSDVYTSFDDGALGISDFFWRLYEATGNTSYQTISLQALNWIYSQAKTVVIDGLTGYHWIWDTTDKSSPYYMGMGEGLVGTIETLATFYQRFTAINNQTDASNCLKYINGSLVYLYKSQAELGLVLGNNTYDRTISETDPAVNGNGNTAMDSGYLSGAAGLAYMYLKLYQVFDQSTYLTKAEGVFSWLEDSTYGPIVKHSDGSVSFKITVDPQGGNTNMQATGIEEGNAGIGWVYLQAYLLTKNAHYLVMAEAAAKWLIDVRITGKDGVYSWREDMDPSNPLIHANLDNGAAGIGEFFEDLYQATGIQSYRLIASGAIKYLKVTARTTTTGNIYWSDNSGFNNGNSGPSDPYSDDMSWHWGNAGILSFVLRYNGGSWDIPGEQSGLFAPN